MFPKPNYFWLAGGPEYAFPPPDPPPWWWHFFPAMCCSKKQKRYFGGAKQGNISKAVGDAANPESLPGLEGHLALVFVRF